MKKILNFFIKPFNQNIAIFTLLFLLISIVNIYQFAGSDIKYCICIASQGFMNSYLLTLVYTYIPNLLKKIYLTFILILAFSLFLIDLIIYTKFQRFFEEDVAGIILNTNLNESLEFLYGFLSFDLILLILVFISTCVLLYSKLKNIVLRHHYLPTILFFTLICSIGLNIMVPRPWKGSFFGKISILSQSTLIPDLKDYYSNPNIVKSSTQQPQNVVIIFGESFSKVHSSLYGYSKDTNPYLSSLRKDSSLIVFNKIESPALTTAESFKSMMSTFKPSLKDSCNWYTCTTLPEIAQLSSYKTIWFSNQSKRGLYDNVVGKYAELCDSCYFVGDQYAGSLKTDLDEELIEPVNKYMNDSLNLIFIHLMGSHSVFESRYPKEFSIFNEKDYLSSPSHQRKILASYDNSVLYNDSVVYSLMNRFKDESAIVFYFSDHSLDIFESSDNFCAHAKPNDPVSVAAGKRIPFMVYCSKQYQEKFPEIVKKLRTNVDKSYNTENIIYTIMDVMEIKFSNNNYVERFSLLQQ